MGRQLLIAVLAVSLAGYGRGCAPPQIVGLDLPAVFGPAEWRSDSLDLPFLACDPGFERRGWTALERTPKAGAWTLGDRARLRLPFRSTRPKVLRMRVRAHESLGPALPLSLSLNGHSLGEVVLGPREQEFRIVLPSGTQVSGDNTLLLGAPRHREVSKTDPDRRPLVAAFSELEVRPLGASRPPLRPLAEGGDARLPPGSSVAYYVRVPGAATLAVQTSSQRAASPLTAALEEDGKLRTDLAPIGPVQASGALQFDLAPWADRFVRIELANVNEEETLDVRSARLLCAASQPAHSAERSPARPPNILLYVIDTLRADRLGAYGAKAPASPHFDAFAREAVLFEDAWAQASWTRAAMASIFTGEHVSVHGLDREDRRLRSQQATLAERLRALGYRTGAFVANHLMGGRVGLDRGFESWNEGDDRLYGSGASELGRRALRWTSDTTAPFFLYVHTLEPHAPYAPGEQDSAPFAVDYDGDRDTRALLRLGQLGQLPAQGLRFLESQYLGEVRKNDRAFGELLDGLRERGKLDDMLVVFTADHGEELLDHGGTEHAKTLYQELIRVPLAVRLPAGQRGGAHLAGAVEQIDLLPTLLRFAGAPPPSKLPGRDLSDWWRGRLEAPAPPVLFSEERFAVVDKFAARSGALKLIFNNDGPALWRAGDHVELYDLAADPGEHTNLADARPITTTYLLHELERFRQRMPAAADDDRLVLSAQEQDALKALGYIR